MCHLQVVPVSGRFLGPKHPLDCSREHVCLSRAFLAVFREPISIIASNMSPRVRIVHKAFIIYMCSVVWDSSPVQSGPAAKGARKHLAVHRICVYVPAFPQRFACSQSSSSAALGLL